MPKIRIVGIIPSRYASTRFPGKPLVDIGGQSMIMRVYHQAIQANSLADVIVATDDARIYEHVILNQGKAVMTSDSHNNGTERCAEVACSLEADYVINIQGDEPFINPVQIDLLAEALDGQSEIVTLIKKVNNDEALRNPSIVKVIKDQFDHAIYFSRQPIPYSGSANGIWYKHIGIYAYRKDILQKLVKLPISPLEKAESLEQLRWIEYGYKIQLKETHIETISIDTPADLNKLTNLAHA